MGWIRSQAAPVAPSIPKKSEIVAQILRSFATDWTPERVRELIASGTVPDEWLDSMVDKIGDYPGLSVLSDEEFIGAVRLINPECAVVFATRDGLGWMHKLSAKLAVRLVGSLFGIGRRSYANGS